MVHSFPTRRSSDLSEVAPVTNMLLSATIIAERYLPVKSLPGVSLLVRARQPLTPRA